MKFLSVCSGIEAASVAWNPLGWEAAAFAEIEPFPCSVLAHHYPTVPNWGDMTKFQEWPGVAIDLLCGGTPCQSFSVAGLRKGLDDPRGDLMLTFGAIAAIHRPRWLVWENVPGVLSSNGGRDFGSFLGLLGILGYGFAYRVLDAQFFGVAQRRRRVFVVGCLGDWRSAAAVLSERHGLSGHPAPRREAGKAAPTIPSRSTAGGGLGTDFDCDGGLITTSEECEYCLGTGEGKQFGGYSERCDYCDGTGVMERDRPAAQAFAIQHAQIGRKDAAGPQGKGWQADVAFTQDSRTAADAVAIVPAWPAEIAPTLNAAFGSKLGLEDQHIRGGAGLFVAAAPVLPFDTTQVTSKANVSNPKPGDPCHPIAAGAHAPTIAFGWQNSSSQGASASASHTPTLDKSKVPAVSSAMQVRRLTPRECERLQGFPDDYTLVPHRGKPAADGPRYKALGNSWAVPCARWIGERIAAVDAIPVIQSIRRAA